MTNFKITVALTDIQTNTNCDTGVVIFPIKPFTSSGLFSQNSNSRVSREKCENMIIFIAYFDCGAPWIFPLHFELKEKTRLFK